MKSLVHRERPALQEARFFFKKRPTRQKEDPDKDVVLLIIKSFLHLP